MPSALRLGGRVRRCAAGIALIACAGLVSTAAAQNESCLVCHQDASLAMTRADREVSLFVDVAPLAESVHGVISCVDCHAEFDANALPHREPMVAVNCQTCHADPGATHAFHPAIASAPAGENRPDTSCVTCHGGHNVTPVQSAEFRFAPAQRTESCGTCHVPERAAFESSAHFRPLGGAGPDCLQCHVSDVVDGDRSLSETKVAQVTLCVTCHVNLSDVAQHTRRAGDFVADWNASVHGRALEAGNAQAANCVDCHGSHEMNRGMVADSRVHKLHIVETCQTCHGDAAGDYARGVHATALQRGIMESPVCTDCHGEHKILAAHDPLSPVAPRNLSQQLCGECHGSVRLAEKYGIASNRFETFADSFHGLAVRGGAVDVVNCASCHGFHDVLPSSDPLSPVHKMNLALTCGQCHPGANERFAVGSVHMSMAPGGGAGPTDGDRVIQVVATVYVWAIVVIVGGMIAHNLVDFFKKVRLKVHGQAHTGIPLAVPHRLHLRMTVHERLQHGTLVLSFVLLVVTGFMLRFPEAWWVVALRAGSDHLFEMRGWLHRVAAVVLVVAGVWHALYVSGTQRGRELMRALWPRWSDARDMAGVLRYNVGLARTKPLLGRFSYVEKLEYWALLWGSVIMSLTGVLLWADETTMGLLAKLGFDIARTVHYYEAVLAALSVVVWHFYFVIFNPDVYPMNLSWLTGHLTEEEMAAEHPRELQRLQDQEKRDNEKQ